MNQLTVAAIIHFLYEGKASLENGSLANTEFVFSLSGSSIINFGLLTNNLPVIVLNSELTTLSDDSTLEVFEGGTYSAGTDADIFIKNRVEPSPLVALAELKTGVTIDTPGILMDRKTFISTKNTWLESDYAKPVFIFKPNTVYCWSMTNNSALPSDYTLRISFGVV